MTTSERAWRDLEFGFFINTGRHDLPGGEQPEGFTLSPPVCYIDDVAQYEFTLDPVHPLTFISGRQLAHVLGVPICSDVQPDRHQITDMASIPRGLQWIPGPFAKDSFLTPYLHDSGYQKRGLWIKTPGEAAYSFHTLDRSQVDKLLEYGIGAEGGNAAVRQAYYCAVRLFGGSVWARHDAEFTASLPTLCCASRPVRGT